MGDIRDPISLFCELQALEKALTGDVDEPLRFGRDLPTGISRSTVSMEAPHNGAHIDETMSPSRSTRLPGIPWITVLLTEMQALAGNPP